MRGILTFAAACLFVIASSPQTRVAAQRSPEPKTDLDKRVQAFLESRRGTWRDLNVPEADGRTLHDMIVRNRFTRAVEIGTSTGHSGVWIAWGLSKTGGKLITIEVDTGRHRAALANFKEAGLAGYIDARLGDAHELVPRLDGPFDFVFSDADKDWYTNYLTALWPKVTKGGCFTAHNVSAPLSMPWLLPAGMSDFLNALKRLPDGRTTIDRGSSAGLSITCKTAP
jgi:predicted O-methyltransferase YrrM